MDRGRFHAVKAAYHCLVFFTKWPLVLLILVWSFGACSIWLIRKTNNWIRIPVMALLFFIVGILGLFIGLMTLPTGCFSESKLIYSPNHTKGARILTSDRGGLGGDTSVVVFSHHGLSAGGGFSGSWKSVEEKDIVWESDKELRISYVGNMTSCESAPDLKVQCVPRDKPSTP